MDNPAISTAETAPPQSGLAAILIENGYDLVVAGRAAEACNGAGLRRLGQFRMAEPSDLESIKCDSEAAAAIAKLPEPAARAHREHITCTRAITDGPANVGCAIEYIVMWDPQ